MGKTLKEIWNEVCGQYLRKFCEIMEMDYEDGYWPGGDIGSVVVFSNGEAFNIQDIRYVVDNNIDRNEVDAWYNYTLDILALQEEYDELYHHDKLRSISLESWCKGAPKPYSEEKIKSLQESAESIRKAKERFIKSIEELSEKEENHEERTN